MKNQYLMSRLYTLGMALVLLTLTAFATWAAMSMEDLSNRAQTDISTSHLYDQARYLISTEESLDWHYHVEPGAPLRTQERAVNASLLQLIGSLSRSEVAADRSVAQQLGAFQQRYFLAVNDMFTAIDTGKRAQAQLIDNTRVDPSYGPMTQLVNTAADARRVQADQRLDELNQRQHAILIGTPLAFGLSLLLLSVFWLMLCFYQRKLEKAAQNELAQLARAALTDNLTGLGNHRAYQQDMQCEMTQARDQGKTLALTLINIDGLKAINEDFGHLEGDRVLSAFGSLLRGAQLSVYTYRLSGDQFALILPDTTLVDAAAALDQLRQDARRQLSGVTVSIGLAVSETGRDNVETLHEQADAALAEAKRRGRNTIVTFEEIRESVSLIAPAKMHALRHLLSERQVTVAFQPIWDVEQNRLLAFEALTRLPVDSGLSGPQEAFDIAEKIGRAYELDYVCVRAILARAAELPSDALLFLNLTPQTLDHDVLTGAVLLAAVLSAGLTPDRVVLEITERSVVRLDVVVREAKKLRALGFRLALDDTGAGNAGLEMLSQLPVDFVKIDRAIVVKALSDATARALLTGITTMARQMNSYVIAEGIENIEMLTLVQETGGQAVQGFLLGRPTHVLPSARELQALSPAAQRASLGRLAAGVSTETVGCKG